MFQRRYKRASMEEKWRHTHSLWRDLFTHIRVSNKGGLCRPGSRCGLLGPPDLICSSESGTGGRRIQAMLLCRPVFARRLRVLRQAG